MPTEAFEKSYKEAVKRNKSLPYKKKLRIWKKCVRDWGNGDNKKTPYVPFPAAEEIHKSKARFLTMACGNRFAKSLIAAMEAVAALTVCGTKTWIVGQQFSVCDNEWDYIKHAITKTDVWYKVIIKKIQSQLKEMHRKGRCPNKYLTKDENGNKVVDLENIKYENEFRKILNQYPKSIQINYPNGAPAILEQQAFGRTDWSRLEGAKVSMIIFAEGSRVPKTLFDRHLRMRLSDLYGRVIIPATPKGRDDFMYPTFKKGLSYKMTVDIDKERREVNYYKKPIEKSIYHVDNADSYAESYESFQFPGFENPYYNMDDYEAQKNALFDGEFDETIFRERCFGTFESLSGNYFVGVNEDIAFVNSFELPEECTVYRGIDPGRQTACCLWVAVQPWDNGKNRYIVFRELYAPNMYLEKFVKHIKEMSSEDVFYSAMDPEGEYKKFANKLPVLQRMKELGIEPLYCPHNLPRSNMARYDLWLPDFRDNRIVVFKDKCPNFIKEVHEAEFAEPVTKEGHSEEQKRLIKGDRHALTAYSYLRWMNPQYIEKKVIEEKRRNKRVNKDPVPEMSLAGALKERSQFATSTLFYSIN